MSQKEVLFENINAEHLIEIIDTPPTKYTDTVFVSPPLCCVIPLQEQSPYFIKKAAFVDKGGSKFEEMFRGHLDCDVTNPDFLSNSLALMFITNGPQGQATFDSFVRECFFTFQRSSKNNGMETNFERGQTYQIKFRLRWFNGTTCKLLAILEE